MKLNKEEKKKVKEFAIKIQPLYELFNWLWFDGEEFPSAEQIEECIYTLLKDVKEDEYSNVSTGGLHIEKYPGEPLDIYWSLEKHLWLN
jgi:hypothetical protein